LRLKSLELHGFKSFPEKTVIQFDEGTTVIVGPNGSGKSNITDAMRWVLGELSSKNIRGSKMEDVIFIGADGYRPMGFAEVSVTFDNTDPATRIDSPYDEITVTRRYYRAGESEYFINRKAVRLRDIHELFMNTGVGREGYSIIGQGRIAEIISKKSDERRGIFDETAGIAKYRFKKQEAQKKLDATEANMLRISDILSELESRVGPLERQSRKAREYLELFAQKKEIDVALCLYDMDRLVADGEKTKDDCRLSRHELEMIQDTEKQLYAQSERLFSASQDTKQESARLYEEIRALTEEMHAAENEYRVRENDAVHSQSEIDACDGEREKILLARSEAEGTLEAHMRRCGEIETSLTEEEEALRTLSRDREAMLTEYTEQQKYLADTLEEQKSHQDALMDLKVRLDVLRNTLSSQSERSGSIDADLEKYESELAQLCRDAEELQSSVQEYADAIAAAEQNAAALSAKLEALIPKEEAAGRAFSTAGAQSQALESRIAALRNMLDHFEGYNNSVRYVMQEAKAGTLRGIHGPISHLISVKQEYTVALETALGAALQNVVVDDESAAKNAIYALKRAGAGRATFYPLTSVKAYERNRETETAASYAGFVGFADALVSTEPRYKNVIGSLLSRIAVFDTLDNATVMAKAQNWRVRAVTLDGQQINAGGSFTGGSARRDSGVLSRTAQIEGLEAERADAEKRYSEAKRELDRIHRDSEAYKAELAAENDKQKLLSALQRADQTQLDELVARRGVIENLIQQLSGDREKLSELGRRGDSDVRELQAECDREQTEIDRIAALRREADVQRSELDDRMEAIAATITQKQISIAEIRKDLDVEKRAVLDTDALIRDLALQADGVSQKKEEMIRALAALRASIEEKKQSTSALSGNLEKLERDRAALEEGGLEYERRINELRLRLRDISAKKELLAVAHEKNEHKYEQITADIEKMTQRLWDDYELTPSAAAELEYPPVEAGNRAPVFARLSELRSQIKALGHVNVSAIEEYAEVKERYDFVSVQMEDLERSKEDLLGIIGSIDGEMTEMFLDAFHKINETFGEVFRELFGGGEAHLSLSDPENVLSSGIEISAAPPGKMIKNLSLLSGGEQSVIAIALLFALVRVNPSPFCIFDEIEAALDEVNVQRVAQYVKRIAQRMQIIMITHRRGTMEIADSLYGVTMPRHGVSKVFTLDMASMSEEDMERAL